MKKHHSKSTHARHLLGNLHHKNECSPEDILMSGGRHGREHHAIGGTAGMAAPNQGMQKNLYGSKSPNSVDMERRAPGIPGRPQYKKGGHVNHRRRHADGGPAEGTPSDLSSVIGMHPLSPPSGNPATALKRGGRAKREHHFLGGMGGMMQGRTMPRAQMQQMVTDWSGKQHPSYPGGPVFKEGGDVKRKGGRAHHKHREHHFLGALAGALAPMAIQGLGKLFGFAEGGDVSPKRLKNAYRHAACGGELKRAMGGAAKVRKGMMTEDGHEIKRGR